MKYGTIDVDEVPIVATRDEGAVRGRGRCVDCYGPAADFLCGECATRRAARAAEERERLEAAAHFVSAAGPRTVLVWRFEDAPPVFRALSSHGGDEDWVAYSPPGYDHTLWWADSGTQFGCCDVSEHVLPGGAVVRIGAHA